MSLGPGRIALLLFTLLFTIGVKAQTDLHVLVQDSATSEALPGASAVVVGLSISATADMDGKLVLRGVPDGAQVLRFAGIGYHAREQRITLPYRVIALQSLESAASTVDA